MQLEDKVLGKMHLVAPNDPTDTDVGKTVLMTGCIDGDYPRKAEVPYEFWLWKKLSIRIHSHEEWFTDGCEGSDESTEDKCDDVGPPRERGLALEHDDQT